MAKWPYNTTAWQTLRRAKLAASPHCAPCKRRGALVVANTVDHVVSIAKGGAPFPPLAGLMSMCPSCHSFKTRSVDRPGGAGVAFKGVDATGNPLDPRDPWYGRTQAPRPLQGPQIEGAVTVGGSKTELVSHDSESVADRWV